MDCHQNDRQLMHVLPRLFNNRIKNTFLILKHDRNVKEHANQIWMLISVLIFTSTDCCKRSICLFTSLSATPKKKEVVIKGQAIQFPYEQGQKDKCCTKQYPWNIKSEKKQTPLKFGKFRCSGRVGSSCSIGSTRRIIHVKNPMISHEINNKCSSSHRLVPLLVRGRLHISTSH